MRLDSEAPEVVARGPRRKGLGVGAVLGRRVLLLLVAAVMAVMMSMGPALAYGSGSGGGGAGGAGGGVGGGQGGGPNGGDGGGSASVHHKDNIKRNNDLCLVKDRRGNLFVVRCFK